MSVGTDPGHPNPTPVEMLKQTQFVPTLENKIPGDKNVIYCPTLLSAWGIVKESFKDSISFEGSNSTDFQLINRSTSSHNALDSGENMCEAGFSDGTVSIRSFFNKELPYPSRFQKLENGLRFGKEKVRGFGMKLIDETITNFTQIAFYRDDDKFVIKITPKDTANEIVLVKGLQNVQTLMEAVKQTMLLMKTGDRERPDPKNSWKYEFNTDDELSVPIVKFNLEEYYKNIEGQEFLYAGKKKKIQIAYQKIALTLDESGGYVRSDVRMAMGSSDSVAVPKKVHPKHIVFDKPFYIIMQHPNRNPYFVMRVDNTELMEKK